MFSDLMAQTLGALMKCRNSLSIKASPFAATILGIPFHTMGGNTLKIHENV